MGCILMEKVLFRKPDFDNRLGMIRPAMLPKNWYELYEQQKYLKPNQPTTEIILGKNKINDSSFIEGLIKYWEYDFFNDHVEYIEKYDGRKYFYYIPLHLVDYFEQLEHIGFSGLEEEVKKDIRDSKCKIILLATDEGYFGEYSDLYSTANWDLDLIQKWCELERFPSDSVMFICMNSIVNTHNQKKGLSYNTVSTTCISEKHLNLYSLESPNFSELTENSKLFLTYNNSFHFHRLGLLEALHRNNLLDNSYHSFTLQKDTNPQVFKYHSELFIKLNNNILTDEFYKLLEKLPIKIENDYDEENYKGIDFKGQIMVDYHYKNSFLSLVSETLYKKGTVYFSEKTFKPIYQCHPFILLSSKGSLKKLKDLGYQTFDRWWDESYDECDDYIDRIEMICKILLDLNSKSHEELKQIKNEMKSILIDNYNNFIMRYTQKISPIIDSVEQEYKKFINNE